LKTAILTEAGEYIGLSLLILEALVYDIDIYFGGKF